MDWMGAPSVRKGSVIFTRTESIAEYKKLRAGNRSGNQDQSNTPVTANDMCELDKWPSHARRYRPQLENETDGQKKKGRGVLKGLKASQKRFANGSAKLNIAFSENLGGTVGMNYRSFLDDVVVIMKRKLPIIGVRWWSDIHPTIQRLIVADIRDRWDLEESPEMDEKILKIAHERYRGWRSTFHSTYKAYNTDAARLANVPEDLQQDEWEWLMDYFGNDSKFQQSSQKNSDNRKKMKTKHRIGSKSYSQKSFEERNTETGEEPDCVALWEITHTKNGTWSNTDSQKVYDQACLDIQQKQETQGPVSSEQRSNIFQTAYKDTLKCKSSQPRGYGYMAKPTNRSQRIQDQFEEQLASATAEAQKQNSELNNHVNELQDQLQAERENTQVRIDAERAEREILEEKLKEERAKRDRLLLQERRSREEFEKNMMAKFEQLTQQMAAQQQQVNKRNGGKENNNPNMQTPSSQTPISTKTSGTRQIPTAGNQVLHGSTRNSRILKAMEAKK